MEVAADLLGPRPGATGNSRGIPGRLSSVIPVSVWLERLSAWLGRHPARLRALRVIVRPVAWPVNKLVVQRRVRRNPQFAAGYLDMQVDLCTRELGPYHRHTLRNLTHHAIALSKLGELQEAEAELTEAITRLNTLGDGDAGLLLTARLWHHHVLGELGWVSETEADARFAADSYARQLGPDHPDTLRWREQTAVALGEAGRHDEARAEMADVAARRAATQGPEHPDTLGARASLASWAGKAGDAAGARDQFAALLPVRERVLGPGHPDTLSTRASLASWTGAAGDAPGARDQFAALLPSRERAQGFDHPDTRNARAWLAYWTEQAKPTAPDASLLIEVDRRPWWLADRACDSLKHNAPVSPRQTEHRDELSRSGKAGVL